MTRRLEALARRLNPRHPRRVSPDEDEHLSWAKNLKEPEPQPADRDDDDGDDAA